MVFSLRRSNVSGSPHIYVINTYAKIRSRNQTATLSLRTYNDSLCLIYRGAGIGRVNTLTIRQTD